jgi:hypothetical protein
VREPTFTDTEAREILQRAIELDDRQEPVLRLDQVRAIAAELGVSHAAFEQALSERRHEAMDSSPSAPDEAGFATPGRGVTIGIALVGFALGAGSAALRDVVSHTHYEALIAYCAAIGLSLWLVVAHRDGTQPVRLQLRLGALWTGLIAGTSLVFGRVWDDVVISCGGAWILSGMVGAAVPWVRRLAAREARPQPSASRPVRGDW